MSSKKVTKADLEIQNDNLRSENDRLHGLFSIKENLTKDLEERIKDLEECIKDLQKELSVFKDVSSEKDRIQKDIIEKLQLKFLQVSEDKNTLMTENKKLWEMVQDRDILIGKQNNELESNYTKLGLNNDLINMLMRKGLGEF